MGGFFRFYIVFHFSLCFWYSLFKKFKHAEAYFNKSLCNCSLNCLKTIKRFFEEPLNQKLSRLMKKINNDYKNILLACHQVIVSSKQFPYFSICYSFKKNVSQLNQIQVYAKLTLRTFSFDLILYVT